MPTSARFRPPAAGRRPLLRNRRGAALVEFALVFPLLATFLFGIVAYGHHFFLAHSVQQIANNAARATIAGLTAPERRDLARTSVSDEVAAQGLDVGRTAVTLRETDVFTRVTIGYDASDSALFSIGLLPLPDQVIRRSAAVRKGGL